MTFQLHSTNDRLKAMNLFLKFSEVQPILASTLIQINNIYIDQRTIESLPKKKKDFLGSLILNEY